MAHTLSAKKRHRQDEKRQAQNRSRKADIKTRSKRVAEAVAAGDLERAADLLRVVVARIDKAAKLRTIHPNKAGRLKSKLTRLVNAAHAKTATPPS